MFKGNFLHSIDSKGRVSIPVKLRKFITPESNNTLIITQGIDKCIQIYPKNEWQIIEEKLSKLNEFIPKESRFIRMMLQNAHEDEMDSQSRILIPQSLLEYAEIKNEVLIIGVLRKIELWNPDIYKEYLNSSSETFEQIAEEVMRL